MVRGIHRRRRRPLPPLPLTPLGPRGNPARQRAKIIAEEKRDLLEWAEANGWGELVGEPVLGDTIYYTFASGQKAQAKLPPGSILSDPLNR